MHKWKMPGTEKLQNYKEGDGIKDEEYAGYYLSLIHIQMCIRDRVKGLSGGERQRLFIVLALIPQPDLVFLDELTTGLDAKARRGVWKTLKSLKEQGLTIFLTSHFMDEVEALCDEICILKKGTPVFRGTVEQAKQQCGCEHFEDAYLQLSDEEVDA